jgi:Histidine phosphatase superfamily (branch 2)
MKILIIVIVLEAICDTTKMVVCVHRHGIRNPDHVLPYLPTWFDPFMRNELTQMGMRQTYLLGRYLRLKYSSFIPEAYTPQQTPNRTIQSSYSLSYGLFSYNQKMHDNQVITSRPPVANDLSLVEELLGPNITATNFLPSVINVVPIIYDTLLAPDWGLCNYYITLQMQVYQTTEWKTLINKFASDVLPVVADVFGFDKSLVKEENYLDLLDFVICAYYNSYISLNSEILELLQNTYSVLFTMQVVGPASMNYTMAKISATNLLFDVVDKFENKMHNSSYEMRFVEYSCHDANIMHILHALNLMPGSPYIGFASNIIFELNDDSSGYSVRVAFNGAELLNTPFDDFKHKVESSIYTQSQWKKLCN